MKTKCDSRGQSNDANFSSDAISGAMNGTGLTPHESADDLVDIRSSEEVHAKPIGCQCDGEER